MSTETESAKPAATKENHLPAIAAPRLPYHPQIEERFGIDRASWRALVEAVFPNASNINSVIMALSYCRARKLDPFKRVVHIVPIWSKDLGRMIDTVWPGIGELRTTAFRTGEYAGRDRTVFGPDVTRKLGSVELTFPEWAQVSVYRILKGQRVEFAGPQVYWQETYATIKRGDDTPNDMWKDRPRGQIDKCAEAAALRAAFPEEIGSEYIPEEVQHRNQGSVVEGVARKSLDDLADELEAPAEVTETPKIEEKPSTFSLDNAGADFSACTSLGEVTKLSAELEAAGIPEDHRAAVAGMQEQARERIAASRGKRQTAGAGA